MPPKQKKKLSFADEVQDKVETVHIGKEMKKKKGPVATKAAAKKSGAAAAKKGIITRQHAKAQETKHRKKKAAAEEAKAVKDDEEKKVLDSEDELESSSSSSNHSAEGSDDDADDMDNPFVKAKKSGGKLAYPALRLRFLPPEFQEPQLYKFLNQFGGTVLNCFCVRSKRTHQSKGIAYVQFDTPDVLPIVLEECHGMALGGRALKASIVTMHRPMPSKELVARRRAVAYAYVTKGKPIKQYDVSAKAPIALLIKAAQTEKENNAHLKRLGIPFESDFFVGQLRAVPAALRKRPRQETEEEGKKPQEKEAVEATAAPHTPQRASKRDTAAAAPATPSPKAEASVTPRSSATKEAGRADSIVLDAVSPSPAKARASQGESAKKKKSASRSPSAKNKK